jgi:hypothetical protein
MKIIEEKKIILAQTYTPLYDEFEDRIRVVVNYQDAQNRIDFMITRNFIIDLVPSIDEFILQYYNNNLIANDDLMINKSTKQNNNNIEKTDNSNLALLHTTDELLVKIDLTYQANTKQTLIVFTSKKTISKALLDSIMLQQLLKSIKGVIPYFKWGIFHDF